MNALVQQKFGAPSKMFAGKLPLENDLGAGIVGGFGTIGIKGKVWSTRYKGEERPLMRADGDGPRGSIDVVIVKAPKVISKMYYAGGYAEGSREAPDCFSTNGMVPDPNSKAKQSTTCALCQHNQWGSRTTEAGKRGKACSDSKRLAVVFGNPDNEDVWTLRNELLGGPMLLRVPAASLQSLQQYGELLKAAGYPYQAVLTRISFDPKEAYQKLVFQALRPLSDAEAAVILELMENPQVDRILSEVAVGEVPAIAGPAANALFAAPLPQQAAPVAPVTSQVTSTAAPATAELDAELDALLK